MPSAPVSLDVMVTDCTTAACPPTAQLDLDDPDLPSGVYFIENAMRISVTLGDAEANNPIHYRLTVEREGKIDLVIPLAEGDATVINGSDTYPFDLFWSPEPDGDIIGWSTCTTEYRDYALVLEATDSTGMTTTVTRIITLGCNFI
jgi:hypothetical protein